jgi:hypothetical protein
MNKFPYRLGQQCLKQAVQKDENATGWPLVCAWVNKGTVYAEIACLLQITNMPVL